VGKNDSEIREMLVQVYGDNAMQQTGAYKLITVLEHSLYSQDRAPNDFFLFPKLKEILKGRHFDYTDDIKNNTTAIIKAIQ
ncbi:hypothetical protein B7P43_G03608, partial [Cryptotermes secundus]